jgi:hypothetical protein
METNSLNRHNISRIKMFGFVKYETNNHPAMILSVYEFQIRKKISLDENIVFCNTVRP